MIICYPRFRQSKCCIDLFFIFFVLFYSFVYIFKKIIWFTYFIICILFVSIFLNFWSENRKLSYNSLFFCFTNFWQHHLCIYYHIYDSSISFICSILCFSCGFFTDIYHALYLLNAIYSFIYHNNIYLFLSLTCSRIFFFGSIICLWKFNIYLYSSYGGIYSYQWAQFLDGFWSNNTISFWPSFWTSCWCIFGLESV